VSVPAGTAGDQIHPGDGLSHVDYGWRSAEIGIDTPAVILPVPSALNWPAATVRPGDGSYMDMAGIVSPLFALAFAFAFAFASLAALVIILLRARVVSALLRATLLLVKARVAALRLTAESF